ncbi:hypothetical protein GCM10009678_20780 [Actinomadura kijaniata]|uniref:Uncharacterized protein n=1 Tax=Actinomadura namibiensis TaxID=182080 RepID=A0A7W3QJ74_ACTNM|nr:hypothetical protein [Actinomadura namibiensis]MBA8949060.1 hypothetical protein [Actinomadura namibiensis]
MDEVPSAGPGSEHAPRTEQRISRTRVRGDLYQASGNLSVFPASKLAMGLAVTAVVTLVITGAFYVRAQLRADVRRPPVTEPVVRVVSDTNPLNMSSPDLKSIYVKQQDWIIPHPRIVRGTPKPGGDRAAHLLYDFVRERGGVAVNRLFFSVTLQNVTGGAVHLRSMRVTGLRCGPPLRGTRVQSGGGTDPLTPRAVLVDLDAAGPAPLVFPRIPERWLSREGDDEIDAKSARPFSYSLPREGSETFDIVALSFEHRSCTFKLAITATLNGESRQITIDDGGAPFAVAGNPSADHWFYTPGESRFVWTRPGQADGDDGQWLPGPDGVLEETTP